MTVIKSKRAMEAEAIKHENVILRMQVDEYARYREHVNAMEFDRYNKLRAIRKDLQDMVKYANDNKLEIDPTFVTMFNRVKLEIDKLQ